MGKSILVFLIKDIVKERHLATKEFGKVKKAYDDVIKRLAKRLRGVKRNG